MTEKTENFSVLSLVFAEPSRMEKGEASGSDRHFAEQRKSVEFSAPGHPLQLGNGVLPSREPASEALGCVIADRGEKRDNTPPDCFREAPAIADLILEPVDFVRPGGVFSGFPEECNEVGAESSTFALPGVHGNGGADKKNSGKTVCKSVFVSGIENIKQKEKKHGNSSLLAGCFNGCYRRHSAHSVSLFHNIHRCGVFFKNIQKTALNFSPACAILCVTGLATRAKAEAAAVTGDDSSEKNIAICLLGRLGRRNPGVSFATLLTQSPLFRALASAGKVTERPQQKEAENDLRPVSGAVPARPRPEKSGKLFNTACISDFRGYIVSPELENSVSSGRCFRQGGNLRKQPQDLHFGLEEGRPREDRRTTTDVFSTSSSPFSYPRENGSGKKLLTTFSVGGCNGPCQLSGPVLRSAPGLPHLKSDCRTFAADHPRRGADRQSRKEESSELSFRRSGSHEGRIARACRHARSVIQRRNAL